MNNKMISKRDWTSHPPPVYKHYKSTILRGPTKTLMPATASLADLWAPVFSANDISAVDADLTRNARQNGEPLGERIVVSGRVMDEKGRPQKNVLLEVWQANAAGRYIHKVDQHDAPIDSNFHGAGRFITDSDGRYRFYTVKPGAYPWGNHPNAWRPNHIHFSLFGHAFTTRLVTQMYFPGDPLLDIDPIFQGVPESVRDRLVSQFKIELTEPDFALGYEFDIVLRGESATPLES